MKVYHGHVLPLDALVDQRSTQRTKASYSRSLGPENYASLLGTAPVDELLYRSIYQFSRLSVTRRGRRLG